MCGAVAAVIGGTEEDTVDAAAAAFGAALVAGSLSSMVHVGAGK